MNRYTIHFNCYATTDIDVLAETEEEALQKAKNMEISPERFDFVPNECSVTAEKALSNFEELKIKAENIARAADVLGCEIKLNPWPIITIQVWNGNGMDEKKETLDSVFWDEERDEIGLETDTAAEITLSDLPLIEQYELCESIVKFQKH